MNEPFTAEQLAKAIQLNLRGKDLNAEDLTKDQLQAITDQSTRELRAEFRGLKISMPAPSPGEIDDLSKKYGGVIVGAVLVAFGVILGSVVSRDGRRGTN